MGGAGGGPPCYLPPVIAPIWKVPAPDPETEEALSGSLGISPLLARLLLNRGLQDVPATRAFLTPRLTDLEDPGVLLDMERAAERLRRAIHDHEHVLVYGDYDVDGMSGTSILLSFIRLAGGRASHYIPNRLKEGYSFNDEAIDGILSGDDPPSVVITVDHGISAVEGIARLADEGVDVLVTDHHEPPPVLPDRAYALVNPRRPGCPSTFKDLCGAAVAFKLAWATAQAFSNARKVSDQFRAFLVEAMGLVALASVTDVVPLHGENRALCFHGLKALGATTNPGLRALLALARLEGKTIHAVHLGFRLGPRLNAAGRMGITDVAIELLTTRDEERARELAAQLDQANEERRKLEKDMLKSCLELPELKNFAGGHGICVGRRGWHVGVIGIVASRLVDRFGVPALVAGLDGDRGRCSARSPGGVHLKKLLEELGDHLVTHGGHAGAAGATVTEEAFPAFKAAFIERSAEHLARSNTAPELAIDLELPFHRIDDDLLEELELLAPHGAGNPPATFMTRGVRIAGKAQLLGRDRKHLQMHLREGEPTFRAVGFGMADRLAELKAPGARFDVVYKLKFDNWTGARAIELELKDIRPSESLS